MWFGLFPNSFLGFFIYTSTFSNSVHIHFVHLKLKEYQITIIRWDSVTGAINMAQEERLLAAKPSILSSIPSTHMVEEENQLTRCPLSSWCTCRLCLSHREQERHKYTQTDKREGSGYVCRCFSKSQTPPTVMCLKILAPSGIQHHCKWFSLNSHHL